MESMVTIPLSEYQRLTRIENELKSGKKLVIKHKKLYRFSEEYLFMDPEESVVKAAQLVSEYLTDIQKVEKREQKLIDELKSMSIWQFIKWRKSK